MTSGRRRTQGALAVARRWLPGICGLLVGVLVGLAAFTFVYANGMSYLGHDPKACASCHVMQDYYDAYTAGPHHHVAECNDCHTPHDLIGKYAVKAENGLHHSIAFTTGDYPQNIRARDGSLRIVNENCIRCHGGFTHDVLASQKDDEQIMCIRCHEGVGHDK